MRHHRCLHAAVGFISHKPAIQADKKCKRKAYQKPTESEEKTETENKAEKSQSNHEIFCMRLISLRNSFFAFRLVLCQLYSY